MTNRFIRRLASSLVNHRALYLLVPAIFLIIGLAGLPRFRMDNALDVWAGADPRMAALQEEFAHASGVDDFILVAWSAPEAMADEEIARSTEVSKSLSGLPFVRQAFAGPVLARLLGPENALVDGLLLRRDPQGNDWMAVLALLETDRDATAALVAAEVRQALEPNRPPGGFRVGGPTIMNNALDEASNRALGRIMPPLVLVIALGLRIALGLWRLALLPLASALLVTGTVIGFLGWLGEPGNMLLSALPALLIIISLAASMHVVWHWRGHSGTRQQRLEAVLSRTLIPGSLCALTTALGLVSLSSSMIRPIFVFALAGAAGVLLSFVLAFSLVPVLLPGAVRSGGPPVERKHHSPLRRGRALTLALFGAAALVSALTVSDLKFLGSPLGFFPEDEVLARDYRDIEQHLCGLTPVQVVLAGEEGASLDQAADRLLPTLRAVPGVDWAQRIGIWRPFTGGDTPSPGRRYLLAMCRTSSVPDLGKLEAELGEAAGVDVHLVGAVASIIRIQARLLQTLLRSLGAMITVVLLIFVIILRQWRQVTAAALANLLPVWIVLGAMALWKVPLDAATVMVLSIALGLAVDDTVHLLFHFRRSLADAEAPDQAVESALAEVRGPVIRTSLITAAGFVLFALVDFLPIARFGVLLALAALIALAADIYLLPVLLCGGRSRRAAK